MPTKQLQPVAMIKGLLSFTHSEGYSLERKVTITTDSKTDNETDNRAYYLTHWIAEKGDTGPKYVVFSSSRDAADEPDLINRAYPFVLDTQKIAQMYVNAGYTCIIPVLESDRGHWVLLLWSQDELRFFDPKSSNPASVVTNVVKPIANAIGSYVPTFFTNAVTSWIPSNLRNLVPSNPVRTHTNDVFKTFAERAKRDYVSEVKEPHVQVLFDMVNCGCYCIARVLAMLQKNGALLASSDAFLAVLDFSPIFEEIDTRIADQTEVPWREGFLYFKDALSGQPPSERIMDAFKKDALPGELYIVPPETLPVFEMKYNSDMGFSSDPSFK